MPVLTYSEQTNANVSPLCHRDGIGCDGANPRGEYGECACSCHSYRAPIFVTNEDVLAYHIPADTYRERASDEPQYYGDGAIVAQNGTVYVLHEQYRQQG